MSEAHNAHALLSASGAHRWATCAPSLRLEATYPRSSNKFADEGTSAHTLGSWALENNAHPRDYPEKTIDVDGTGWPVAPMVEHVAKYVDLVREYAKGGNLLVEQRVSYADWIGIPDSYGTSDSVILFDDRCVVVDLKYGMGVRVDAESNEQLMLYALGALYEYEMLGDFRSVTVVICQPRLDHVSEWTVDVTSLKTFALKMKAAGLKAIKLLESKEEPQLADFSPEDSACRFCKAKAKCPALLAEIETETRDFFAPIMVGETERQRLPAEIVEEDISRYMSLVERAEEWCKAVRAEVERRLLASQTVIGWKLVQGRRGPRAWSDEAAAEAALKGFRLRQEEMYKMDIISPTTAEKLLKDTPKRWAKMQALITQSDGKPSVAPASDKRPAIQVSGDQFASLASTEDLV